MSNYKSEHFYERVPSTIKLHFKLEH